MFFLKGSTELQVGNDIFRSFSEYRAVKGVSVILAILRGAGASRSVSARVPFTLTLGSCRAAANKSRLLAIRTWLTALQIAWYAEKH